MEKGPRILADAAEKKRSPQVESSTHSQESDPPVLKAASEEGNPSRSFPIVGMVASAGGLDAFKKFFSSMSADCGMAFVLIPHLDPSHASLMVELLSGLTSLPVHEAKHGMLVHANTITIIPPNHFMSIANGRLQLSDPPPSHAWKTSIDFFLRSLARDQGECSIGIVLSGTGSHGSLGVREIKLSGGMVMAQDPKTAEHDQMPLNAIATGIVDYILPPAEMPAALVHYIEQPYLSQDTDVVAAAAQSSDLLNQILVLLQSRSKYDFRAYRKAMVLRRIQRRMGITHLDTMTEYLALLQSHPEEVTALYKDLLISVTAFFRDPEAYQVLEQQVLPAMLSRHRGDLPVRVWIPGCATGEEAYSLAMLLSESIAVLKPELRIQIFASDIDASAIEVARTGIYPTTIAADVSPERLKKFFVVLDEHRYQISKPLRESVVFSHQNLIGDAPFSRLDLISCRNLLIYLEPEMQKNVISLFHFSLVADGYLLLGPSETIGRSSDLFKTVSKKWRVFQRIDSARRDLIRIPIRRSIDSQDSSSQPTTLAFRRKSYKELAEQLILNEHAPAAALCSQALEVLYVTGPLANFLEFPRGELTKDLLAMARNGLRTKLRAACRKAVLEGRTIVETHAKVSRNGQTVRCSITARPLFEPKEAEGLLLVLFNDHNVESEADSNPQAAARAEQDSTATEDPSLTRQLEVELKSMSEELHSTIEEMESSNEELKTSNEEIMSVNEELQSVNEELETSKEELQSLNEELNMLNAQLGEKVSELKQATEDLMNLMASTEIATIFLDPQLNIKRFTPPTKSLLNLLATDIGRPLKDIAFKFSDGKMLVDCQHVLRDQRIREREVHTEEPRFYLRRILPYRTTDDHVTGVVITFIDITQQRESEALQRDKDATHLAEMHESAERIQAILNTAADAIVTVDTNGTIESVNLATESLFQYKRREILGKSLSNLLPTLFSESQHEGDSTPTIKDQLTRLVGHRREVIAQRKDETTFPVELALSRVDHLGLYTGIIRDLTVRKQLQSHILEIATEEQSRIGQELHDGTQQELAGLTLYAGAIQDSLEYATRTTGADPDTVTWTLSDEDFQRIQQTVGKLKQGLIESNQHVHKLSHGIMPVQIDAKGLQSALAELADSTNDQQEIRCRFEFSGAGTITNNAVATQLYRIAQESLNNAIKHGKADDIRIALCQDANQIRLEIEDNGTGIDLGAAPRSSTIRSGLGLRIMSYRASILGGELQVLRNAGRGTTVRCTIPTTGYLT